MQTAPVTTTRRIERQSLPWWWWGIGYGIWATFVIAVLIVIPPGAAAVVAVVTGILLCLGLAWWGRTTIAVGDTGVQVGRSTLEWPYVGEIRELDAAQAKRRLGPEAKATAWLAVRPWLTEAVEIEVRDPADPHPYWLVGCRDSIKVAKALVETRTAVVGSADGVSGG